MKNIDELIVALAKSEQHNKELEGLVADLTDFIENASLPLHWVNGSGIIIWANQAELDLLGYEKNEYIGRHIGNFHVEKNVLEDILRRLIAKETLRNYASRLKCKNGEIKHVLINSNVRWDGSNFLHTRCFTRDISELKRKDDEKVDLIRSLQEQNKVLREENERLLRVNASR